MLGLGGREQGSDSSSDSDEVSSSESAEFRCVSRGRTGVSWVGHTSDACSAGSCEVLDRFRAIHDTQDFFAENVRVERVSSSGVGKLVEPLEDDPDDFARSLDASRGVDEEVDALEGGSELSIERTRAEFHLFTKPSADKEEPSSEVSERFEMKVEAKRRMWVEEDEGDGSGIRKV